MDRQFDARRPNGSIPFGASGADLAAHVQGALAEASTVDQGRLAEAFEAWSINEIQRTGRRPSEQLMQQLRVAALGPTLRGSRTSLNSWSSGAPEKPQSIDDDEREAETTAVVENAQRARNLISHRRKVVRGVLRAIADPGDDSSSNKPAPPGGRRSSRPEREPLPEHVARAEQLRAMRIWDPPALGEWAARCFEFYVDVQRRNTQWSSALANNHKAEWLDFLLLLEPAMELSPRDTAWLRKRQNFEERFATALHVLRAQAGKPGVGEVLVQALAQPLMRDTTLDAGAISSEAASPASEQAGQPVPAGYRSMFADAPPAAPQASPPEPQLTPPPAQAPPAQATIDIVRTAQGITLVIDADAYGVRDLEETAFTLSLMLLDPSDPTEVRVRAIPGPPRQIEMTLGSLDVAKGLAARARLLELLGAKPTT